MHGHVIAIGRRNARMYYTGARVHDRDAWSFDLAQAAWFASADAATTAADTLLRWRGTPAGDREIEYHHLEDRIAPAHDGAVDPTDPEA